MARPAAAASVTVGAGETLTLTADVVLAPTDTFTAQGTADAPCLIDGQSQFHLLATDFPGTITISHCTLKGLGASMRAGIDVRVKGSAAVRIEDNVFSNSGLVYVLAADDASVSILRNDFGADGAIDPHFESFSSAEPAVKVEGMSTQPKLFQGNRVLRSFLSMFRTQHWLVGGLNEADGNIFDGIRGGIYAETISDVTFQGNYLRTPAPWDRANQLTTFTVTGDSTGVLVEHNLIRGGNGIFYGSFDGEIRYNIVADPHAAFWIDGVRGKNNLKIHHNLLLRSEKVEDGALYWRMNGLEVEHVFTDDPVTDPKLEFYNNTMDTADCYNPPGSGVTVADQELIKSVRNNVFMRMPYEAAAVAAYAGDHIAKHPPDDPGPPRMLYADYNDFFNRNAPNIDNYALTVAGKTERVDPGFAAHDLGAPDLKNQQVDPVLVGPLPRKFPFDDAVLDNRTVTVCQVLALYRKLYAPTEGKSPLIDSGDPADGAGVDIGAIGAGVAHPDDRFGLGCLGDIVALPVPSGDSLVCTVAPVNNNPGGGGGQSMTPAFLCVCTTAAGPSAAGVGAFFALLGVAALRRRRGRARDR